MVDVLPDTVVTDKVKAMVREVMDRADIVIRLKNSLVAVLAVIHSNVRRVMNPH